MIKNNEFSQLLNRYGSHINQTFNVDSLEEAQSLVKMQKEILRKISQPCVVMYLIDLEKNRFVDFRDEKRFDEIVTASQDAQIVMNHVVEKYVHLHSQENLKDFVNLNTIENRIRDKGWLKCDFQAYKGGWYCAKFIPIAYDEKDKLTHVLFFVEHITQRKLETQLYQYALEYNADYIYHFDLTEGIIQSNHSKMENDLLPTGENISLPMEYDAFVDMYFTSIGWTSIKGYGKVYKREEILKMYEQGVTRFQTEYYSKACKRYYRSEFYLQQNKENNHIIVMVVRTDITKEYLNERQTKKVAEVRDFLNMAMSAFAKSYKNVYVVELDKNIVTIIKHEGIVSKLVEFENKKIKYDDFFEKYVQAHVAKEDLERVHSLMLPQSIHKNMENNQEMRFVYRAIEDGQCCDFETGIIKTDEKDVYVIGFRNIDDLMMEEKKKQEAYQQAIKLLKRSDIYLGAISSSYDVLMIINLTNNTYDIVMRNECMTWDTPASGNYTELCTYINKNFPEDVREEQEKKRTVKNYLNRFYNGETYWEERHQICGPDGNLHWMRERVMCSKDRETGDIIGVSVANVIDKEVKQENSIRQITEALSREYMNVYLINPRKNQIIPVLLKGFAVDGLNRKIGAVSPYWELVLEYAKTRVYEEDREQFIDTVSAKGIEKGIWDKGEMNLHYRIVDENKIHDYQVKFIRTENAEEYICAFKNIDALLADERRRQKIYEDALKEAKKANQAKRDFLSRMSHDIRTPINGIVGMAHIMKEQIDSKNSVKDGIEQIERLSKQLELLIDDVLEMSRIESGKTELSQENFDLYQLIEGLIPSFRFIAQEKGILLYKIQYKLNHAFVVSSPVHIQRICMNLISNAIKYNREGGSVMCKIKEIPVNSQQSNYEFTVTDTGIGMSKEFIEHIYEPFTRVDNKLETEYKGTGLGMAITKEFVDLLGGSIEIESELGVGSKIKIVLPLKIGKATQLSNQETKNISFEGKRVLLVEDNKVNLKFAKFLLENEKMRVDVAINGLEAVEMFSNSQIGQYDLILMDVMMPVMDGLDATRAIRNMDRKDAKKVPILAMSANAFAEDVEVCRKAGMNDHIAKPLDIEIMKEKISRCF